MLFSDWLILVNMKMFLDFILLLDTKVEHVVILPYEWKTNTVKSLDIRRTLVGNKIVDHSDVVGASPVGAAPTTSSFSTEHVASMDLAKTTARRDEKRLAIWCILY